MMLGTQQQGARPVEQRLHELRGRASMVLALSIVFATGGVGLLAAPSLAVAPMEIPLLAAGAGLLALAIGCLSLWQSMRRRVLAIHARLSGAPAPPAMTVIAESRLPGPTGRRTAYALGGLALATVPLAAYFILLPQTAPADRLAQARSTAAPAVTANRQPCAYAGEWLASRDGILTRVTLQTGGQFAAQPVARGGEFEEVVTGAWGVRGDRMEWTYAGQSQPREVKHIQPAGIDRFSLKDADGGTTEYRRVGSAPACAAGGTSATASAAPETPARRAAELPVAMPASSIDSRTTLQCQFEVNGRYDGLAAQGGNGRAAELSKRRVDELRDCEKLDRQADAKLFDQAYGRLDAYLDKVRAGQRLTPEEKATLEMDYKAVSSAREQAAKHSYLDKAADLYQRLNGSHGAAASQVYPQLSCADYQGKLKDLRSEDQATAAELARLKRADGSVSDQARWSSLNQKQAARLADMQFFSEGARVNSCKI